MWLFYTIASLFLIAGIVCYARSREFVAKELGIGSGVAFLLAFAFHGISILATVADREVWSGTLKEVVHYPAWTEQYTYTVTHTDGKRTWTETRTALRHHPEYWSGYDTIPQTINLSRAQFNHYTGEFSQGGSSIVKVHGSRSGMIYGDPYDYHCACPQDLKIPTTAHKYFTNRIKAGPTAFAFEAVDPKDRSVPDYPEVDDPFRSDRLVGRASRDISTRDWDLLNSRLGPTKKINLILVGLEDADPKVSAKIRAKWLGGKKNDLVLVYSKTAGKVVWADVFGWTKSELCKANLRTLLLEDKNPQQFLDALESEVVANYTIRDWSEFDYITIEPPLWCYVAFFATILGAQGWFFYWALTNRDRKSREKFLGYALTPG